VGNSRLGTITIEDGIEALDRRDYWDNPLATREERDALLTELAELRRKAAAMGELKRHTVATSAGPSIVGIPYDVAVDCGLIDD
jgi:hypothetical protein